MNPFPCYSYRKRDIEYLLSLTNSFTWEELPKREPDTGYVTYAGYIPIIQSLSKYMLLFGIAYHTIQSTVRIVMKHDTIFPTWFPIDASSSPVYEIVIFIQVMSTLIY